MGLVLLNSPALHMSKEVPHMTSGYDSRYKTVHIVDRHGPVSSAGPSGRYVEFSILFTRVQGPDYIRISLIEYGRDVLKTPHINTKKA